VFGGFGRGHLKSPVSFMFLYHNQMYKAKEEPVETPNLLKRKELVTISRLSGVSAY
jgi:hypothetical protein